MRQFDVFVFDEPGEDFDRWAPPFTDPALGWFHTNRWNGDLERLEAEWIVFAHPSIKIDRDFLNELAIETDSFPMVDAFAPRVKARDHFFGGLAVDGSRGFSPIGEEEELRYVAAPIPLIGVFSRRIIQRTGLFDLTLPKEFRLMDYSLRMAHAGGKMFSVPYLVAHANENDLGEATGTSNDLFKVIDGEFLKAKSSVHPLWNVLYTTLPASNLMKFTACHPTTVLDFFKTRELKIKRDKATALSKLTEKHLRDISAKRKSR